MSRKLMLVALLVAAAFTFPIATGAGEQAPQEASASCPVPEGGLFGCPLPQGTLAGCPVGVSGTDGAGALDPLGAMMQLASHLCGIPAEILSRLGWTNTGSLQSGGCVFEPAQGMLPLQSGEGITRC